MDLFCEAISISDADKIMDQWRLLSKTCVDPNPYYEPDYLLGVFQHMLPGQQHCLVLMWSNETKSKLVGLFPITKKGLRKGFLFPVSSLTSAANTAVCTPLVDPAYLDVSWPLFLNFLQKTKTLPSILHVTELNMDLPCGKALEKCISTGQVITQTESEYEQPVLDNVSNISDYAKLISPKKIKNFKKRYKKINEMGVLEFHIIEQEDAFFTSHLSEILALEASDWKGKEGTAITSNERTRTFAKRAFLSSQRSPKCDLAVLKLDGKIIAGMINLVSQGFLFSEKLAYDRSLSRVAPGVMLDHLFTDHVVKTKRYKHLSSCSNIQAPVSNIWTGRERIRSLFVQTANAGPSRGIYALSQGRQMAKNSIKIIQKALEQLKQRR